MPSWTKQQQNAINSTGGSVLVSAAAGSGKTAVLVERVIKMITSPVDPIDVDRLLVVTFTRDAAAEMKHRIADALDALLEDDPFNEHLLRQSKLLYNASICTIDSFCGDLVKEYFHTLGVSSDYRIAEKSELELFESAAMDLAMEDFYNNGGSGFSKLLDAFSGKDGDYKLRETVWKIRSFLETQPFPDVWLDEMYESYGERDITKSIWGKIIIEYAEAAVNHAVNLCENSFKILLEADKKLNDKLHPVIEDDMRFFQNLQQKLLGGDWDGIVDSVQEFIPKKLNTPKGYSDDPQKLAVAANRESAKDSLIRLKKYFCRTEAEAMDEFAELQDLVGVLFSLTRRYISFLDEIKQKKNTLTFSDIELLAVKLLARYDEESGYIKTELGYEISSRFDAVIVDEYQDVNDVQNLIFNCVSDDETNLFTVGDVKQCVYGFRQAKPQIFVKRRESYGRFNEENPTYPSSIYLDKNFRSRAEVCDTVNFIFSRLMTKETAGMDYTRDEYLNVGAEYPPQSGCQTELTIIDTNCFQGESSAELEAGYIARRIREIMSSGFLVTDHGVSRPPTYGDFAVMLRSEKNIAAIYVKVLSDSGIPAYCEEQDSAFDALEVKILLNILRITDNPALDIPLLSVLCSPVYGFTPDELAQIRAKNRYSSLYSALKDSSKTNRKAKLFLEQLASLRSYATVCTVDELIGRALETTSLGAVTCAVNGGDAPLRNLNLIRHFARGFEAGNSKNLSDFVFYIDKLIDSGVNLPSASSIDADSVNGVRVLSIHKSKGLEYPFCFLASAGKKFNKKDLSADVLIDSTAGLGIKRKIGVCRYNTLPRLALEIEIEREEMAEELRVLYVALTRAREKLMIIGSTSRLENYVQNTASKLLFDTIVDPYTVTNAIRILDWITLCALVNPSSRKAMLDGTRQISVGCSYPEWIYNSVTEYSQIVSPFDDQLIRQASQVAETTTDTDYAEILRNNLSFVYPDQAATNLPQKVSASQIAHTQSDDYFEKIIVKPRFISGESATAVERGTAHHQFLQFCDFAAAREDISGEIKRLESDGVLSPSQTELIDKEGLLKLLKSPLFDRVISSDTVYREERFTVSMPANLIYSEEASDDPIVMQGAVDLAFVENGKLVIVDYKTDRVSDINKLVKLYKKQLDLYREAMRQSLEIEVGECVICSVALNESVSC